MWFILLSGVLWPRLLPLPHPLAISCHNASLCLCNEKQHSSGVMTSSVSTGVGQGRDPVQGLGSTRRKLGTKSTSCRPSSAVHACVMLLQTRAPDYSWQITAWQHYQNLYHGISPRGSESMRKVSDSFFSVKYVVLCCVTCSSFLNFWYHGRQHETNFNLSVWA